MYIKAGSPDTWVRPGGWVDIPSITSADTKFYGVYAVYENRKNNVSIGFASGTFNITIDWGDGSSNTTVSSISTQTKSYTYSGLTSPILQDAYGQNYKTVLVTITQNSGALTQFNFGGTTTIGTYNWLDIIMSWSTARVQFLKAHPLLQRFIMYTGSFSGANANQYVTNLSNCRVLEMPVNLGTPTSISNFFSNNGNCEIGDITVGGAISISSFFSNTLIRKIGNFTALNANGTSIFSANRNLIEISDINIPATTSFNSMFSGSINLIKVGTVTSTAVTNIQSVMQNCFSIKEITFTDLSNVTTTTNAFSTCYSLENIRVPGLKVTVSFVDCAMERAELVQVFNDLGTPVTTQTITVTRNPGSADLTAADILIATSKNWTVTL